MPRPGPVLLSGVTEPIPSPQDLARADLPTLLRDPARKQGFVTPMFEHIAPRYDAFTRLFSFGMDRRWKSTLGQWLSVQYPRPRRILDVACGTGDLARAAVQSHPAALVRGIDAASRMIAEARRQGSGPNPTFEVGDLMVLPAPDGSIDAITAGYAFRNVPDLDRALAEMARVLSTGGMLYVLDFYRPRHAAWRALFLWYLRMSGSLVGWWWHRAPVIYAYIADSIAAWVTAREFEDALRRHGFEVRQAVTRLGGGVALHAAARVDR